MAIFYWKGNGNFYREMYFAVQNDSRSSGDRSSVVKINIFL